MRLPENGRAAHPKLRASSLRHYSLDETLRGASADMARGKRLVLPSYASIAPPMLLAPTPRAVRYLASTPSPSVLAETIPDTELITALQGDWTIGCLFRMRATPTTQMLFAFGGFYGDAVAANNLQACAYLQSTRKITWLTESGAGVASTATLGPALDKDRWLYLAFRKSATTSPGGTCTMDLFVNGGLAATAGFTAPDGGAMAVTRLGHLLTSSPAQYVGTMDFGGLYVWGEPLTNNEIADDARRIRLMDFSTHVDISLRVQETAGGWRDLCDLDGVDFVDVVDLTDDVDNATLSLKATMLREQEALTLAGLVTTSKVNLSNVLDATTYAPLMRETAGLELLAARVPLGIRAGEGDFESLFLGNVDDVDDGGDQTTIVARDEGGRLIDTFIEEEIVYSDAIGSAVDGEMQFILNDNDNSAGNNSVTGLLARTSSYAPLTLYTPLSPAWSILQYRQRREPVLNALRALALQIGWDCRYRYDQSTKTWRLTFFDVDRARTYVESVVRSEDVLDVKRLQRSILGVRNIMRVIYPSSETTLPTLPGLGTGYTGRVAWFNLDGQGQRMVAVVEIQSDTSLTVLNRRLFMEVQEQASSQIDTVGEATDMCLGMLKDLEEADLGASISFPLMHEFETNDLHRFEGLTTAGGQGLRRLFTGAQNLAVKQLQHSFNDSPSTTLQLRGKPTAGFKRLLALETRQGRGAIANPLDALTDVRTGPLMETVRALMDKTNTGTGGKFLQIRNPEFTQFTAGLQNTPDGWAMSVGAWPTDITALSTTLTGGKAIKLISATAELLSDFVACVGDYDVPYSFEMVWQWGSGTPLTGTWKRAEMVVEWYDVNKASIQSDVIRPGGTAYPPGQFPDASSFASATWFRARVDGISPPANGTARFLKVRLRMDTNGAHTVTPSGGVLIDSVSAYRTAREDRTFMLTPYTIVGGVNNDWYAINLRSPHLSLPPVNGSHDWGHNHFYWDTVDSDTSIIREDGTKEDINTTTFFASGFYCKEPGTYLVTAQVLLLYNPAGAGTVTPPMMARVMKNATYTSSTNQLNTGGSLVAQATGGQNIAAPTYDAVLFAAGYANGFVSAVSLSFRIELVRGDRLSFEFWRGEDPGAGTTVIIPVADYQHTWWNVRLGLAE